MRCHYVSDLHLESQAFETSMPGGDVLIIAGDLCHARCLDPARVDRYSVEQRGRVLRFIEEAVGNFRRILLIAGNHEHYDGVFEDTTDLLHSHLPGVTVLDNEVIEIEGVRFFGGTLWTNFDDRSIEAMNAVRRRMGEFFFVKTRAGREDGALAKFQPEDALREHDKGWAALREAVTASGGKKTVVITHHTPSHLGLNPRFAGNGLDPAYASCLDVELAKFRDVPVWVHGHTHIAKTYRIGSTVIRSNALGFAAKGQGAPGFSSKAHFDIT